MFEQRIKGIYLLVILIQLLCSWGLFAGLIGGYHQLSIWFSLPPIVMESYPIYGLAYSLGFAFASFRNPPAHFSIFSASLASIFRFSYRQWIASLLFPLVLLALTKEQSISRGFLMTFFSIWLLLLVVTWKFLPFWLARLSFSGRRRYRILFYGSREKALKIQPWVTRKHPIGFRILGAVQDHPDTTIENHDIPRLGGTSDLEHVIETHRPDILMLVEFLFDKQQLNKLARITEKHGVRLLIHNDLEETFGRSFSNITDDEYNFIYFRHEPLENPFNRFLKRFQDILISLAVILTILPLLMLLVWIIHRRHSPGPLFFIQERSGLNRKSFRMLKFRTMHLHDQDEAQQASQHDERIFPGGQWLRRYSLDEFPQFINVLKGEMSIVGPRAHLELHNQSFANKTMNYHVRKLVLPGITGLAQIRGHRGEIKHAEDIVQRLNSDIEYIENWSPSMDWWILLKTVVQVFFPPARAY